MRAAFPPPFRLTRQQNPPMFPSRTFGKVFLISTLGLSAAGSLITLTFLFVAVQTSNICMKISKFGDEKVA